MVRKPQSDFSLDFEVETDILTPRGRVSCAKHAREIILPVQALGKRKCDMDYCSSVQESFFASFALCVERNYISGFECRIKLDRIYC